MKTLVYADIFDYPLKAWEAHKWLIGRQASLKQVEKALHKLIQKSVVKNQGDYFFISSKRGVVNKRILKEKVSRNHWQKTFWVGQMLRVVPWVKLVGVSGSLAISSSKNIDDIDLFIITAPNRLWLSRLMTTACCQILGLRRKRGELKGVGGKLCLNLFVDESQLKQERHNLYMAREVLQMKALWQRGGVYQKYLEENSWAFRFLPNWSTSQIQNLKSKSQKRGLKLKIFDELEDLAKWLQLKIMGKPSGAERIKEGALYFHPQDAGPQILESYRAKLKSFL